MIKFIQPKEFTYKKCFALFPKRIGGFRIWLRYYYKTWDYTYQGPYSRYIPRFSLCEEDVIKYIEDKKRKASNEKGVIL